VPKDDAKAFRQYRHRRRAWQRRGHEQHGSPLRGGPRGRRRPEARGSLVRARHRRGRPIRPRRLGQLYRYGKGVRPDPKRALRLFELAADRGFLAAYADIASMHEQGDGSPKTPNGHTTTTGWQHSASIRRVRARRTNWKHLCPLVAVERQKRAVAEWRKENPYSPGVGEPS
jgi:TPR repeat protein